MIVGSKGARRDRRRHDKQGRPRARHATRPDRDSKVPSIDRRIASAARRAAVGGGALRSKPLGARHRAASLFSGRSGAGRLGDGKSFGDRQASRWRQPGAAQPAARAQPTGVQRPSSNGAAAKRADKQPFRGDGGGHPVRIRSFGRAARDNAPIRAGGHHHRARLERCRAPSSGAAGKQPGGRRATAGARSRGDPDTGSSANARSDSKRGRSSRGGAASDTRSAPPNTCSRHGAGARGSRGGRRRADSGATGPGHARANCLATTRDRVRR